MNVYEQVKQALQDVVAPELKELRVEIRRLDDRINSQKAEIVAEIRRLDEKIDTAIQIRERLAALEAKSAAMERRETPRIKNFLLRKPGTTGIFLRPRG